MASKSSRIDTVSQVLPDDHEIVSQDLLFRKLLSKYSVQEKNNDDLGLDIDEAVRQYRADDVDENSSSASDEFSDNDAIESDTSYDYKDAQKQLSSVVKERRENWKKNGLDKIVNDVCFRLSTTFVEDWLKQNCPNSNKQLAMDRETRVTTQDGDSTMDLTQRCNLTFQNDANQQTISTLNSSNYEVSSTKKKIVIHQVEKTTLTTVATIVAEGANSSTFSLGTIPGFDLNGLSAFQDFQGFKIPNPISELRHISMEVPKPKALAIKNVACVSNAAPKETTGNHVFGILKQDRKQVVKKPSRVAQKPLKETTSRGALTDSDDEENIHTKKRNGSHKQSANKPSRVVQKPPEKITNRSTLRVTDDVGDMPSIKHHEKHKKPMPKPRKPRISSSSDESVVKSPEKMTVRSILSDSDDEENIPVEKLDEKHKQLAIKPARDVQQPQEKMTNRSTLRVIDDVGNVPLVKQHEKHKETNPKPRKPRINSSDDESVVKVQSQPIQRKLQNSKSEKNSLKSSKSKYKASEFAPRLLRSNNETVTNDIRSVTKEKKESVINTGADDSSEPSINLTKHRKQQTIQSDTRKGALQEKPEISVQSKKYIMSLDCQKRLTVGGRCRYNIEGTVIYRPRCVDANLPKDTKKIEITKQDLDLSVVASESKRKKFENFKKLIHPNSTIVYYMSDSEVDDVHDDDELSDEDDDPLASFHPFVVFEYAYQGV